MGLFGGDSDDSSIKDKFKEGMESVQDPGEDPDLPALDCKPRGDYVNEARYDKVESILDPDEVVHYITRGSTIDVEGSGAGESLFGNDRDRKSGTRGWMRAVFTQKRVAIKIPQFLGTDERSVPYNSVTSVDLDTGLVKKRISLQTKGQTYHIEVDDPGKEEVREIVRFVREKSTESNQPKTVVKESQSEDPLDRIEKLQNLREQGAISDEEFEEKKQDLMDRV